MKKTSAKYQAIDQTKVNSTYKVTKITFSYILVTFGELKKRTNKANEEMKNRKTFMIVLTFFSFVHYKSRLNTY